MNAAVEREIAAMTFDVIVVGAGPAGIVAASLLAEQGKYVAVVEQMSVAGGQIWRNAAQRQAPKIALRWLKRFQHPRIRFLNNTRIVACDQQGALHAVRDNDEALHLRANTLIFATGARERFLPFPGWTLPGVTGAGALQVMVKDGLEVRGKNVVVAGTGPLLFAVADTLLQAGANVQAIVEQRSRWQLIRFAASLWRWPRLLVQAAGMLWRLRSVPLMRNAWVSDASGETEVKRCTVSNTNSEQTIFNCDWLACGYGLLPNQTLTSVFAAQNRNANVKRFSLGDCTQVAGVNQAIASAERLTMHLLNDTSPANETPRYAKVLQKHFPLRAELLKLADNDTLLCRCEGVTFGEVRHCHSMREAKLYHRLGMGRCQGAICTVAATTIFGWQTLSPKLPLTPAPMRALLSDSTCSTPSDHQGVMP